MDRRAGGLLLLRSLEKEIDAYMTSKNLLNWSIADRMSLSTAPYQSRFRDDMSFVLQFLPLY